MDNVIEVRSIKRIDNSTADEFRNPLIEALEKHPDKLVINMEDTSYISSIGLRILTEMHKQTKKKNIEMTVKNPQPVVKEIFVITGFSGFLRFEEG